VLDDAHGDYFVFEDAESEFVSEAVGCLEGGDAGWRQTVDYHSHTTIGHDVIGTCGSTLL